MKDTDSVIDTENEFQSAIFYEFVILARPESIPESDSESESPKNPSTPQPWCVETPNLHMVGGPRSHCRCAAFVCDPKLIFRWESCGLKKC